MTSVRWTYIAGLVVLGAGAVAAWTLSQRPASTPPQSPDTWVAPIAASTDSGDVQVRRALGTWIEQSRLEFGYIPPSSLFDRCGSE